MLDRLYQLDPRQPIANPVWSRLAPGSGSGAATTVSASVVNDQQQPFLVSTVGVWLTPGAAQFARKYRITIQDAGFTTIALVAGGELQSVAAAEQNFVDKPFPPGTLILPQRYRIACLAIFNAGANSNAIELNVLGWFIPRGTLGLP